MTADPSPADTRPVQGRRGVRNLRALSVSSLDSWEADLKDPSMQVFQGDARNTHLKDSSVDLVVTSPPYWAKRDYGHPAQIGQERSPTAYVKSMMDCLDEWMRVLRPTGSVFLNIGDTYANRSLAGIPGLLEAAAMSSGWLIRNRIIWAKPKGMPEPARNRLANRHEYVIHLTPRSNYYYDLYGYAEYVRKLKDGEKEKRRKKEIEKYKGKIKEEYIKELLEEMEKEHDEGEGNSVNPGDVWAIGLERNMGKHLAPFPQELVRRAILLGCPPQVCETCGVPRSRVVERTDKLDPSRPQARRAMELARQHNLTPEHIRAIQATGVSDVGKATKFQSGTGRNSAEVQRLATEAKAVLGGYFREFTFAKKETVGWTDCGHGTPGRGVVFDPFMGTGTTLRTAVSMNFDAIGVDLVPLMPEQI